MTEQMTPPAAMVELALAVTGGYDTVMPAAERLVAAVRAEERNRVTVDQIERAIHDQECGCDRASGYCNHPFGAAARAVHRLYIGEAG